MEDFEYLKPNTVAQAASLLEQIKESRVIAGGQSLIPMLRSRLVNPTCLVSLDAISDLQCIEPMDGGLRVGAMVPHRAVSASPLVRKIAPILAEAEAVVGSPAVRNLGTLGGNVCHNGLGADPPPALIALGATAVIAGTRGERRVAIESFFKDVLETVLAKDEILTFIDIPAPLPGMVSAYMKYRLRAVDTAIVGVAVVIEMEDGVCRNARVALGGVTPVPFRSVEAEAALVGKPPTTSVIKQAAQAVMAGAESISDSRGSADYRRKVAPVITRRTLTKALGIKN